jgi:hypothetical protein
MHRNLSIFLAGAIAVSGAAGSFESATAMPLIIPAVESDAGMAIEKVKQKRVWRHRGQASWRGNRNHWRPRHYAGNRHYRHRGHHGYRHYDYYDDDDDFEAAAAFGLFGLATGAILGSAFSGYGYGPGYYGNGYYGNGAGYYGYNGSGYNGDHAACAEKYRSYDPASGTYLGYDGERHQCVLP